MILQKKKTLELKQSQFDDLASKIHDRLSPQNSGHEEAVVECSSPSIASIQKKGEVNSEASSPSIGSTESVASIENRIGKSPISTCASPFNSVGLIEHLVQEKGKLAEENAKLVREVQRMQELLSYTMGCETVDCEELTPD